MHKLISCLGLFLFCSSGFAHTATVQVLGRDGIGLSNVVVYLQSVNPANFVSTAEIAIMDQVNTQFLPHILLVQKGTQVSFPNSDSIKHHVYSFSPAKVFELQLYSGLQTSSLVFSKAGVVELGCNVHDWMLGYIYVVDSPYFAKTDSAGLVKIEVPEGRYKLNVWHPLIQDNLAELASTLEVNGGIAKTILVHSELLPNLEQFEELVDEFSEYN